MEIDKNNNDKVITLSTFMGQDEQIVALMDAMNFYEIGRQITGGYMSSEMVQITFMGKDSYFDPDLYLKAPHNDHLHRKEGTFKYFSVEVPDGHIGTYEGFLKKHKRGRASKDFEIGKIKE